MFAVIAAIAAAGFSMNCRMLLELLLLHRVNVGMRVLVPLKVGLHLLHDAGLATRQRPASF